MGFSTLVAVVVIVACLGGVPSSANLSLNVAGDDRRVIELGTFGFDTKGVFSLQLNHLFVYPPSTSNEPIGFLLEGVGSAQYARVERNAGVTDAYARICFLDLPTAQPTPRFNFDLGTLPQSVKFDTEITVAGAHALFFYNCRGFNSSGPSVAPMAVSFEAVVTEYNVNSDGVKNFLQVGDAPLPTWYFVFFAMFAVLSGLWARQLRLNKAYTHKIHLIMLVLVVVKTLSLLFECIKFYKYSQTGEPSVWDFFYYFFLTAKALTLFGVVVLLGTGWSIIKSFTSENDRRLLGATLVTQVIVNICIAVVEETNEGHRGWDSWYELLHILDVICCCAVLLPIVWSIKNLRGAAEMDDKAALTLSRMRTLRTFYVVVVVYIYASRIIIVMIEGVLPFRLLWIGPVIRESIAVLFYAAGGYQFRPRQENAFIALGDDDMEELQRRQEAQPASTAA